MWDVITCPCPWYMTYRISHRICTQLCCDYFVMVILRVPNGFMSSWYTNSSYIYIYVYICKMELNQAETKYYIALTVYIFLGMYYTLHVLQRVPLSWRMWMWLISDEHVFCINFQLPNYKIVTNKYKVFFFYVYSKFKPWWNYDIITLSVVTNKSFKREITGNRWSFRTNYQ